MEGNDADAFRHTYVSGVFTQEYNEEAANIFGQIVEEFVALIESGEYSQYTIKETNGLPTPVSKRDGRNTNNLG